MPPGKLEPLQLQAIQPKASSFKLSDGRGLYLLVQPSGAKYWRLKYRIAGREKSLALGVFPNVSLEAARAGRDEARQLLASGGDPMAAKRESAKQREAIEKARTVFRLSMESDALTIQFKGEKLALTPEQTAAVRAFLLAAPCEAIA